MLWETFQCSMCVMTERKERKRHCCDAFTIEKLEVMQEYEKLKASDPDFYRAADSMSYGGAGKVPDANIDKMVAELNERYRLLFLLVNANGCIWFKPPGSS